VLYGNREDGDMTDSTLYLRLSDFRDDSDGFAGREARLRAEADRLGWTVARVVVENDVVTANGNGRTRPASAFKRRKVTTPGGKTEWRVYRPGFRSILELDIPAGRSLLCEDLDRACRDPRDLEDLVDAVAVHRASARSISGSLTLTDGGTDSEVTMARIMVTMANKSSRDTARRVAAKRGDLAAAGAYGGGRRPFGYRPDPGAPKHAKTLLVVESEAAEIRNAAGQVLANVALRAIARDWRDRGVPSVTGAQWSAETVRDVLVKPAVAGLVPAPGGSLAAASWPAILEHETWEALRAKLSDPARRTNGGNANEPRYLLSGIARCHCGSQVKVNGGKRAPAYACKEHAHLRRNAAGADATVAAHIVAWLGSEDAADLLRPPSRPGVDVAALRRESAKLAAIGEKQAGMHALGDITDAEYRAGARARKDRLAAIASTLQAGTERDPLAEFRDAPDAGAVWESLTLPRRREIARLLADVTLMPATFRGSGFDAASVRVLQAAA
jgi:DNA invertase Pin-like site-specific DNA recombinase